MAVYTANIRFFKFIVISTVRIIKKEIPFFYLREIAEVIILLYNLCFFIFILITLLGF